MIAFIVAVLALAIVCGTRMIHTLVTGDSDATSAGEAILSSGCGCVGILFTITVVGVILGALGIPVLLGALLLVAIVASTRYKRGLKIAEVQS